MTGPNGSTFGDRLDDLSHAVGDGVLRGEIEMNQVYAHYQWAGISRFTGRPLVYHQGGRAHFLNAAENSDEHMQRLADAAITEHGSDLHGAMVDVVGDIRVHAEQDAPREFENLSRSGAETVYDGGEIFYYRPPDVPRLTDAQLHRQRSKWGDTPDYGSQTRPRL